MKTCNTCSAEKPLNDFYKKSKSRQHIGDGYENKCKECTKSHCATPEYRQRANELRRKRGKTEKQKEANRKWSKEYYKTDIGKQKANERTKKYRSNPKNAEKIKQRQALYRKTSSFKKSILAYRQKFPERREATVAVANAVASGNLIRPDHCTICETQCTPEGHHHDYSKPLEVIWVCKKCHTDYHWSK